MVLVTAVTTAEEDVEEQDGDHDVGVYLVLDLEDDEGDEVIEEEDGLGVAVFGVDYEGNEPGEPLEVEA